VEAHISRKTDEAHKGETGSQHREKLQPGGGSSTNGSTASSGSESSGSESSGSESSSELGLGERSPVVGPVEEADESSEEAGESGPVTIPVPAKPEEGDGPESDESGEQEAESEEEMSLLTLALLGVGAYLALRHVFGGSEANQRRETPVPGV
jgi:hypothetical protein